MATYAIISLCGKQYRVREGEGLLVDRLPYAEGEAFHPRVLLAGGDGAVEIAPQGVQVTARVARHMLGEKIRIGKYKPKTGYRRHMGHRSRLSQIEIESIAAKAAKEANAEAAAAETKPKARARTAAAKPKEKAEAKPKADAEAEAKPKAARKPRQKKTETE